MKSIRERLSKYLADYLNPRIVFIIDLVLSSLASVFALLLAFYATKSTADLPYGTSSFGVTWLLSAIIGGSLAICSTKSNRTVIRHTSLKDVTVIFGVAIIKEIAMAAAVIMRFGMMKGLSSFIVLDAVLTVSLLVAVRVAMLIVYEYFVQKTSKVLDRKRVLVYGCSDKSASAAARLQNSSHYCVVGFVADGKVPAGMRLMDFPVYVVRADESLKRLADRLSVRCLLFADENEAFKCKYVIDYCVGQGIKPLVAPTIDEFAFGKAMKRSVREVEIEDLLGRDEIVLDMDEIRANFSGKTVMVTGAAGSIGSELCRQLAASGVKKLVLFDNAETPMHNIRLEMEERYPELVFVPVIGDVRLLPSLDCVFRQYRPQIVFHAAAYKHVPLMEENPCEAVLVNVFGSRNVADKCLEYGVEKMVMVSTDKAVNPTNIMGCTKRLAEIYVQSLGLAIERCQHEGCTKFVTTRFGNVLGSNGSVIPRFREQIEKGGPVTVTHPDINRFFMTIPEACRLVMEAATISTGNQIFVFDMGESVKIADLAKRMIELAGLRLGVDIDIEYTGLRPGEKLYEEVLSNTENTISTQHERIRIAKVREYDYTQALESVERLTMLASRADIPEMVKYMKAVVPEFKSKNSRFEEYDK